MTAIKAHEVEGALRRGITQCFVLVYGPDIGLVNERCGVLSKRDGADATIIKLEGDAIAADPGLLMDEAHAISMFGGARVVWIRGGGKAFHEAVEPLMQDPPQQCSIIIEAGDLKPSHALRKLFEGAGNAIALPCYADDARELARIIDEELAAAKLNIGVEARRLLQSNLGGDRQATRQEIRKLCLYAHGQTEIDVADVMAVTGDVSALALDGILDQLGLGEADLVIEEAQRHMAHGTHASVILTMATRHVLQLQVMRFEIDEGRTSSEAVKSAAPPIFFKRQPLIERQLVAWSQNKIGKALDILNDAVLKTRQLPQIANTLAERALMDVAALAKERRV